MQVPLLDLKLQYRPLATEIQAVIEKVCASQAFILGPAVKELEASVAAYSQCSYGIGVSSGTDALLLALMALEIGPGDEVITSPFTFFATAGTIARAGARPLFCDIEPTSFNLSPHAVAALISKQCERRDGDLVNRATGGRIKGRHARTPLRADGGHGAAHEFGATARSARHRGRGPGDWGGRCKSEAGVLFRRRRVPVLFSPPRIWVRSGRGNVRY